MAVTAPPLRSVERESSSTAFERGRTGVLAVSALTILAVVVHGYHPYAEDGGLYLAGVKRVLDPELYPYATGFTTAHLHFSLFAPIVAMLVHATHLGVMTVMLLIYVASIWATLFGAWQLAMRVYSKLDERFGAVLLVALLLTVPVAGTSLMLMDPYVSARSISTPCTLWALAAMSDIARRVKDRETLAVRTILLCFGSLFLAMIMHPLMGAYALECVLILAIASLLGGRLKWTAYVGLCALSLIAAVVILRSFPVAPPGYMEVARTRTYWFVSQWHWYEVAGLMAPLLVLAWTRFRTRSVASDALRSLAQTGLIAGGFAVLTALLFARIGMSSYTIAKLQPLRIFQTVYVLTIICVGAATGQAVLKRQVWRWTAFVTGLAVLMLVVQRSTFPHSSHLELPWVKPTNGWELAFTWIKTNTPVNAVFALDADYITAAGEDSQNFRAIAERSAIPDYSKDGGIASIAPDLTAEWMAGATAQKGLDHETDTERINRLRGMPARWIILSATAATSFACDYVNEAAKVCRLPTGS